MSSQTQRLSFAAAAFTVLYAMGLITKTSVAIAGLTALCAVLFAALPPNALEMHHFHSPSPALLKWKTMGRYLIHQPAASSDPEELAGPFNVFTVDLTCPKESCRNTGRTLVIAHGFPTSSFDFSHMIDRLWEKFDRVVIPDFLGFGFSDKPLRFTYSFHKQADLILDVMRQLGVARAHFLVHDYGVSVMQEITARVYDGSVPSDLVQSASYLNGGVVANSPLLIQTLLSHDILGPILSKVTCYPLFRRNFKRIFGPDTQPSETEIRDFWSLVTLQNGHKLNHRILKYLDDRKQHQARWTAALRTESPAGQPRAVPYVAINGPADPVSGRHVMERLKELVPSAQIRFLTDNIGHYPQLEAPDQVLRFFFEFIDGVSSGQQ